MGRTLQNTMVNLALENACDEAMYQVRRKRNSFSYRLPKAEVKMTMFMIFASCSWVWTWKNWRKWRKTLVWGMEALVVLLVGICVYIRGVQLQASSVDILLVF